MRIEEGWRGYSQQRRLNIASRLMGEILRGGGDYTWTRAVNKIKPFSWLE